MSRHFYGIASAVFCAAGFVSIAGADTSRQETTERPPALAEVSDMKLSLSRERRAVQKAFMEAYNRDLESNSKAFKARMEAFRLELEARRRDWEEKREAIRQKHWDGEIIR